MCTPPQLTSRKEKKKSIWRDLGRKLHVQIEDKKNSLTFWEIHL